MANPTSYTGPTKNATSYTGQTKYPTSYTGPTKNATSWEDPIIQTGFILLDEDSYLLLTGTNKVIITAIP